MIALVLVLALVALAAAALLPGSHSQGPTRFGVAATARSTGGADQLDQRISSVVGVTGSAKQYSAADAARENQGVDLHGQLTSDLTPLPKAAFDRPIAEYRLYAAHWAGVMASSVGNLRADLAARDRAGAEHDWDVAYYDFLHLGADYNLLPQGLTNQLAEIPSTPSEAHFPGLHRIEKGLWTGQPTRQLLPVAAGVAAATRQLQRTMPRVPIEPLDYALRVHEILEDADRDLMSGSDVPWSGAGVLGTAAGVAATRELLRTLSPVLAGRGNVLVESENWLDQLQRGLKSVRRRDGSWPRLGQLTRAQRERIDAMLAGTLGALQTVPGALETKTVDEFPSIPRHGERR